jgi:imidazolonepropionase-like amidohydrolase
MRLARKPAITGAICVATAALSVVLLASVAWLAFARAPQADAAQTADQWLVLTGAKIYTSPADPPIAGGSVAIHNGKIAQVGKGGSPAPAGSRTIDCTGLVITAGFQNSHVHFTEEKWTDAAHQPAAKLSQQLAAMLTRWGDTTAVDLASDLTNTNALRARVNSGEIAGPRILTAGAAVYPPNGTPYYLRGTLPPRILKLLEQFEEPATPDAAVQLVRNQIAQGADVTKLFTGSLIAPDKVMPMPEAIARAAVEEAHRHGRLVFAHPSNLEGLKIAMNAGVDVLAHTTSQGEPWSAALVAQMLAHHMSLIPTLKLWEYELAKAKASPAAGEALAMQGATELGAFERAGGLVMFGTDVGYMTDYDPTQEYVLMSRGGLTPMQILAALTTAPAQRFGESQRRGRITTGMDADLAVLGGDPAKDVRAFANVRYTIRAGRVIYTKPRTHTRVAP